MHRRLTAAFLFLHIPGIALSQQPDTVQTDTARVTRLETIEVTSSIAPTAGPTIGSGIPARISTVTGEAIDAWEPRLLADVLATQPGVSVFLDGVRQNEPDAAEVNFDLLPMEHVQRVELLSGSGSLLGPNSLGGAVNL